MKFGSNVDFGKGFIYKFFGKFTSVTVFSLSQCSDQISRFDDIKILFIHLNILMLKKILI